MNCNGLRVTQRGQVYSVFIPNGILVAQIYMGCDNQFMLDAECMKVISKVLAKRWNVRKSEK